MTSKEQHPESGRPLAAAREAALAAGKVLREGFSGVKRVSYKGEKDPVTQFDTASEKVILDLLKAEFPDHEILAEETGAVGSASDHQWYVDPLDGTVNFAHGVPAFSVSIAYEHKGELEAGLIYDPISEEMFTAEKGRGVRLNGRKISVSSEDDLGRSLLATGFPYDIRRNPDAILKRFNRLCVLTQGLRRLGSAALDLAWVAAGRFDGFWEQNLHPWDVAAGVLMVREAGGLVTDFKGEPFQVQSKEILATNGLLHYNVSQELTKA